jgi:hypothetical protein
MLPRRHRTAAQKTGGAIHDVAALLLSFDGSR